MSSAKKNTLCLKEKIELIKLMENNKLSVKELQQKYKCGKTQIYYIIKRRDELKQLWEQGTRADMIRKRKTSNEDINKLVWEWFINAKSQNLPVNGTLLKAQAKLIAEQLGNNSFKASNGWLESFRKRNSIVKNEVCEERKDMNHESVDDWKKRIPSIIQDYKAEDIFSGGETGLFFRVLPGEIMSEEKSIGGKQTLSQQEKCIDKKPTVSETEKCFNEKQTVSEEECIDIKPTASELEEYMNKKQKASEEGKSTGEKQTVSEKEKCVSEKQTVPEKKCIGGKQSSERVTIFLCCSLKGEKEIPLVIGKAAKPRCFENLCLSKLPVLWKSNKYSYMNSEIMEEWLHSFDNKMQMQERNVLLFMGSDTCNPDIPLKNVKIEFLPKNSKKHTNPLEQGIIQNLKIYYRKLCIESVRTRMNTYESMNEISRSISVLDAILWISSSWNGIKENVIESCFKKAGFPSNNNDVDSTIVQAEIGTIKQIISETFPDTCDADQYVSVDNNISTAEPVVLNPIDDLTENHHQPSDDSDEEMEDASSVDGKNKIQSYTDALKAVNQIRDFSLMINDGYLFNLMNNANYYVQNTISFNLMNGVNTHVKNETTSGITEKERALAES